MAQLLVVGITQNIAHSSVQQNMTAVDGDGEIDAFRRAELSDANEAGISGAAVAPPSPPLRLPKSCSVFTCNDPTNPFGGEQTFYIVGTAHVSRASCEDVKAVIRQVKPEVILRLSQPTAATSLDMLLHPHDR